MHVWGREIMRRKNRFSTQTTHLVDIHALLEDMWSCRQGLDRFDQTPPLHEWGLHPLLLHNHHFLLWERQMHPAPRHRIWWILLSLALKKIMDSLHHITILLTTTSVAFWEELPLCCCEWPAIVQWDTVPSTHEINFNHILDLHLPYGMKLIFQTFGLCMFGHKCLDHIQFLNATSFKTTRIMKAEIWSTLEYHLILNIMLSTLKKFSCYQGLMKALYLSGRREDWRINLQRRKSEYEFIIVWLFCPCLVAFWIKNFRLFGRVANSLEYRRLASICSPDYQNTKPPTFFLKFFSEGVSDFVIHIESGRDQRWRACLTPNGDAPPKPESQWDAIDFGDRRDSSDWDPREIAQYPLLFIHVTLAISKRGTASPSARAKVSRRPHKDQTQIRANLNEE
jgi:hypothetical protein